MRVWPARARRAWAIISVAMSRSSALAGASAKAIGRSRWGGHQVEAQPPEVAGVGGAVAVFGPSPRVRALLGCAAVSALDGRGVHQPQVVMPRWAVPGRPGDDVLHREAVVGGSGRQMREPWSQMGVRVAQETGLGSVSQQRLDHRQGDQLGVGQLGSDPHRGSLGHPLGMLDQQIINCHIYCGSEGVEVRVHTRSPGIGEVFSPQILDTPTPKTVDYPPTPLGTTHLGYLPVVIA